MDLVYFSDDGCHSLFCGSFCWWTFHCRWHGEQHPYVTSYKINRSNSLESLSIPAVATPAVQHENSLFTCTVWGRPHDQWLLSGSSGQGLSPGPTTLYCVLGEDNSLPPGVMNGYR